MKRLKLSALNISGIEVLSKEQMKNVLGKMIGGDSTTTKATFCAGDGVPCWQEGDTIFGCFTDPSNGACCCGNDLGNENCEAA